MFPEPSPLVVWLEEPDCQDAALVGGKAASLSRLAASYPVPPGFCLTTQAYARWAEAASREGLPPEVETALETAYAALARKDPATPLRVAVRSSAVGEDGQAASFAGQYASYLNVSGLDDVAAAVGRCWASGQDERVHAYQEFQGHAVEEQPVGVLVQQLIAADVAFVAFSAHPVTGRRDEVVINANWGLGESIVNGSVVPDSYHVRKADWAVTADVAVKECMTVLQPSGVKEVGIPRSMRKEATLTGAQACEIAQLATRLEASLGWPVDIEGACRGDRLYLLQCRPISTLSGPSPESVDRNE